MIFFSRHARKRMVARGISVNEVIDGIRMGSKGLQKPNKVVSSYRHYRVVYRRIGEDYYVITIMLRW